MSSVRAGMYLRLRRDEESGGAVVQAIDEMCRKLLANPVMEEHTIEREKLDAS